MRILANDPGAKPGWAVVETDLGPELLLLHASEHAPFHRINEFVQEAQHSGGFLYRNGKRVRIARRSQQTLSFTAGRQFESVSADRKYRIEPNAWRAILWPGSRSLPKRTVVARLRKAYPDWTAGHTDDVVEAIGIAVAWSKLTQKQKEKYRVVL